MLFLLKNIFKELRPHQWSKNLLIFLPLITSHQINLNNIINATIGFVCFSITSSIIYIINDILDIEDDKKDFLKKLRPIASGAISIKIAIITIVFLLILLLIICGFINRESILVLCIYFIISNFYSLKLKKIAILDVHILSLLYILRVIFGHSIMSIANSPWLIVFCGFFFLSLACLKRVSELHKVKNNKKKLPTRRGYVVEDLGFLSQIGISCALISNLVMGLYLSSDHVRILYKYPDRIWFLVLLLLYWNLRIWFLGNRNLVDCDPIVFVFKDKVSYFIGLLILLTVFYAI